MKNTLYLLLFLSTPCFAQKKSAPAAQRAKLVVAQNTRYELRGVVTYFFNDNYGFKPDVGANAYIIKDGIIRPDSLDAKAADDFRSENMIYTLGQDVGKSRDDYNSAKRRAIHLQERISSNPAASTLTADGQGVFTKKLVPGTYWVLIASANRDVMQMQKVVILDDDIEVSAKFGHFLQ